MNRTATGPRSQWRRTAGDVETSHRPFQIERAADGDRPRSSSWSQCVRKNERGLSMDRLLQTAIIMNVDEVRVQAAAGPSMRPALRHCSRSGAQGASKGRGILPCQ